MTRPMPTPELFTMAAVSELKRALPEAEVAAVGPLTLTMDRGGEVVTLRLHNLWNPVTQRREPMEGAIQRLVDAVLERPETAEPAHAQVMPLVRTRAWVEHAARTAVYVGLPQRPLVDDIVVAYALDGAHTLRLLSRLDADKLALSDDALHALALSNLGQLAKGVRLQRDGALRWLELDGNQESSLLLLEERWPEWAASVRGDVVATVPARNWLAFTGTAEPMGIPQLQGMANDLFSRSDYLISPSLVQWTTEGWLPMGS